MDWIFSTRNNDIISKRCKLTFPTLKALLYLTGRSDQLFNIEILTNYFNNLDNNNLDGNNNNNNNSNNKNSNNNNDDLVFKHCGRLLYEVIQRGDLDFINKFMERYFSVFREIHTFEKILPQIEQQQQQQQQKLIVPKVDSKIQNQSNLTTSTTTLASTSITTTTTTSKSLENSIQNKSEIKDIEMDDSYNPTLDKEVKLTSDITIEPPLSKLSTNCNNNNNDGNLDENEKIIGTIDEYFKKELISETYKTNPYGINEKNDNDDNDNKDDDDDDDDDDDNHNNTLKPYKVIDFKRGRTKKDDRKEKKKLKLEKDIEKKRIEKEKHIEKQRKEFEKERKIQEKEKNKQEEIEKKEKLKQEMKKSKPSKKDLQLIKYNQFGPKEMIKYRLIPPQEFPNSKIQFLLTFLSLLSKFGRLDIIKYLDQKYPFLLSKKSSLKNHSAKIEHRLLNPIFTKSDLVKILLLDSLKQLESLQNNKIDLNKSSNAVPNNVLKTSTNSIPENKGLKSSTTNLNKSAGLKLSQLFVNPLLYSVASEDHMVLQVSPSEKPPSPRDIEAANNEEDDDSDNIPMNKVDSNLTTTPGGENNNNDDEEITDDGNVKVVQRNKYLQKWDEIWSKFQGIILLVLSAGLFSVMALAVKQLSKELSSLEITFFRPKEKRLFLSLRGLSGTIGLCTYFYTITVLPLSEAVIISFTNPVMTAALAAVLLKEKWGPVQAICAFLSLCGITVISKPSFLFHDDHNDGSSASHAESDPHKLLYIFIGIIGAFFGAISYIAVRKVCPNVHAFVLVTYFSGLASLVTFPSAFIFQTFK
ncbi:hypothetical protein DDB_G0282779 [Dictyostelium discoideum AX4]|uniref:EamA domain-containing protein n=1 Tax=Dictyostelium discoideum TaxID=44689 RepID=Q54SC3_DICDI|nr:hypothetical protein DDB_G0282779 [Dictyostelium discoideum AX4]EAL66249.1 hypothetical protein DDB_G0282779 [Dictyostelium discoideum AX4]|eukprot:XP_640116.1 hypothetical protein DDB_G0282779 [Dictyostelium discoideum AX4]